MSLTTKQTQIMTIVCRGNTSDETPWCDIDQVLEGLAKEFNWNTTKQSLQFSIRALIKKGMVEKEGLEKRRGRKRVVLKPTDLSMSIISASATSVSDSGNDLNSETVELDTDPSLVNISDDDLNEALSGL